jgi:hypothetical protein
MFAPFDRDCKPSSRSARVVYGVIGDQLRPRKQTEKGTPAVIGVLLQAFAKGMLRGRFGQMTAVRQKRSVANVSGMSMSALKPVPNVLSTSTLTQKSI